MALKKTVGEKIFDVFNYMFLTALMFITIYPFVFVLFASMSNPYEVQASGGILFWPKGFNLGAYKLVFDNPNIVIGYKNTLIYVVVGTAINIFLTSLAAYGLSRKWLYGRGVLMFMITFTMFFGGGLVPRYLLVRDLGLLNTRWALMLPNAIAVWNVIVMRTYFLSIPESMEESAKIDGAHDYIVLYKIIMPLAIPVVAVMVLFYAVNHWNAWFNALIYLRDRRLYPLQMFLREILIQAQVHDMADIRTEEIAENLKYATIMVSTLPILCVYPFLQKYFVKGIMIGAIKG